MKKTININLGGRIFHIEDDAFASLDAYLNEVKTKFGSYPDSGEIIADIEDRIAEHFESSDKGKQETIISTQDVERLIAVMGHAAEFESEEDSGHHQTTNKTKTQHRARLYRNPDDIILGGVASGIAAYFDWDPLWVRLAFAASVFLGGYTIILYIVLWIIVPVAETESDRLEMKGDPITLASLEKNIKEKVVDNPKAQSAAKKAGSAVGQVFSNLNNVLKKLFFILGKAVGLILMVGAVFALFGVSFALVAAIITGNNPNYIQFPMKDFLGNFQYYLSLFTGYVIAFIPLLFAFFVGLRFFDQTKAIFSRLTVGLVVIWFVAIGTMGAIAIQNAPRFEPYIESQPMFQQVEKEYSVGEFTALEISDDINVNIIEGKTSVKASATQLDLDRMVVENKNGTLVIDREHSDGRTKDGKWCLFCPYQRSTFTISVENLQNLTMTDAVNVNLEKKNNSQLIVAVRDASHLNAKLTLTSLQVELKDGSRATLEGTVKQMKVIASDASSVNAESLVVENADATAIDASRLSLYVTKTLKADATDASRIEYKGGAVLTGNLRDPEEIRPPTEPEIMTN